MEVSASHTCTTADPPLIRLVSLTINVARMANDVKGIALIMALFRSEEVGQQALRILHHFDDSNTRVQVVSSVKTCFYQITLHSEKQNTFSNYWAH